MNHVQQTASNGRIRVAILIGQTGLGGYERQLFLFLKYSDKRLFDYHIIVLNRSKHYTYDQVIRAMGVQVWELPSSLQAPSQRLFGIYRLLRKIGPQILHSWSFYANPYAALGGALAGVPLRIGSQRNEPFSPVVRSLPPLHRWLAYRSVSDLVVNAKNTAEQIARMGYPQARIHLVYNGVELLDLSQPSSVDLSAYDVLPDHRIVATVGNLQRRKNQHMFIDAMAQLLPSLPDVRCLIIGQPVPKEPHMWEELQEHIDRLQLSDKICLTGVRNDVPQLMRRLAVFCLTSQKGEGLPNVILEAMAAGCPVVATRIAGVPEVIQNRTNGFLVDSEDATALASIVSQLLSGPALAARIGAAGRVTVENRFSCEKMARTLENLYSHILGIGLNRIDLRRRSSS